MSMNNGISIIIPVYNADKYIKACLDSITQSTFHDIEIICINDGSTDNSKTILDEYAQKDCRIRVKHIANAGVSNARNQGLKIATKKYITFVDADDTIHPNMYMSLHSKLTHNKLDCICCGVRIHNYNGKQTISQTPFNDNDILNQNEISTYIIEPLLGFREYSTDCLCQVWNKLFISSIIKSNNITFNTDRSHGEDWQFCIEYYKAINNIGFDNTPFYNYIHHSSNSLVSNYRENFFKMEIQDWFRFNKLFPNLNWESPKKQNELYHKAINSTIYYREHLKTKKDLHRRLQEMYEICIQYDIATAITHPINKGYIKALNNQEPILFRRSLMMCSHIPFAVRSLKKIIKKCLAKVDLIILKHKRTQA